MLHEMDYQKYISVRQDYVLLPEEAHTNTTRLRWWQPFVVQNSLMVASTDRAQWALDNILIGGSEINPSQLMDFFDDGKMKILGWLMALLVFICQTHGIETRTMTFLPAATLLAH